MFPDFSLEEHAGNHIGIFRKIVYLGRTSKNFKICVCTQPFPRLLFSFFEHIFSFQPCFVSVRRGHRKPL